MAFQPFGYLFEVSAKRPVVHTKAALREGMVTWWAPKTAPRGWILGPFFCVWMDALNRHGPMVIGTIRGDEFQTRISGRAGSDLNGMLVCVLIVLSVVLAALLNEAAEFLFLLLLFGPISMLWLWFGSKDRHDADPIVRFIERTATSARIADQRRRSRSGLSNESVDGAELTVNEGLVLQGPSEQGVYEAIAGLDTEDFVFLAFGPEQYIQAAKDYDRYVLERRDGDADNHFAVKGVAEFDQVVDAMIAYLRREELDPSLRWVKM